MRDVVVACLVLIAATTGHVVAWRFRRVVTKLLQEILDELRRK